MTLTIMTLTIMTLTIMTHDYVMVFQLMLFLICATAIAVAAPLPKAWRPLSACTNIPNNRVGDFEGSAIRPWLAFSTIC